MNQIEALNTIGRLSSTQIKILQTLANMVKQREAEAERMALNSIHHTYRLTMEDQRAMFPDSMNEADIIEKMWRELDSLRMSCIHRLKGATVQCDNWILKFSRNIHDHSLYIMVDKNMLDEYRALAR